MVNLKEYFRVWGWRLAALKSSFNKIRLLPKDARIMQAVIVRNACLDFIKELEPAFETILSDFVRRQDESFLTAVDDIHLLVHNKKSRPFGSDLLTRIEGQKEDLAQGVKSWAQQAGIYEETLLRVRDEYKNEVYEILGEITITYGVSPRGSKKKP